MEQSEKGYIRGQAFYHKCGMKLFEFENDTVLINHKAYCRRCKEEFSATIISGKVYESSNSIEVTGYIKNGSFYHTCGMRVFDVRPNAFLIEHEMMCPRCKKIFRVTIINDEIYTKLNGRAREPNR